LLQVAEDKERKRRLQEERERKEQARKLKWEKERNGA